MSCPDEKIWFDVAGGLLSPAESLAYIEHAATCDSCSQKLRIATRIFEDELSEGEEKTLNSLPSGTPGGQRKLAEKLGRDSMRPTSPPEPPSPRSSWRKLFLYVAPLAAGVLVGSFLIGRDPAVRVEGLLADAYTENRSSEMRFVGARHADFQQYRGSEGSVIKKPEAYFKAAAEIKSHLTKDPDNPNWLLLQAQLDLLDSNYKSALMSLDSIHDSNSDAVRLTLAVYLTRSMALYERGGHENQPEFYGEAEDLLGKVLQKEPANTTALFNQAVVCAKLNFCECTIENLKKFLQHEKDEGWKKEARQRLDQVLEKKTRAPESCVTSTTRR